MANLLAMTFIVVSTAALSGGSPCKHSSYG